MLTYCSDKPSNPDEGTRECVVALLYDLGSWLWYDLMPFMLAILVVEWGVVLAYVIGDSIKGGWT